MYGKHAVITGGANGIGRRIAHTFLDAGALVTVIDIDEKGRSNFTHNNYTFFQGNIAEKTTLEEFVASLQKPVDCLVNNAFASKRGLVSGCSWEDFGHVQQVCVTAPYYLTHLLLQSSKLAHEASIVNIASTRGFQSQKDTESYSAAKGGIIALTHAMSVSLAGKARVNAISPGWIETRENGGELHSNADKTQHPAGRVGTPDDIAQMTLFLCDNTKSGFITGENIIIDGGMSRQMIYHGDCGWKLE